MVHNVKAGINRWWSNLTKWDRSALIVFILWIIAQVILVILSQNIPQKSDPGHYLRHAQECVAQGQWYPTPANVWHVSDCSYIVYAGYINYEIAIIKATGDFRVIFWLNILLNCITLLSIRHIIKYLAGKKIASIATIVYCLAPWTVYWATTTMSDLPCMALIYLSIALIGQRRIGQLLAAGVIIALAQYVRSIAVLFALASLVFMIFKRYGLRYMLSYCAAGLITIGAIVAMNYRISDGGVFISATTFGNNFIQGANDVATGGYCGEMFHTPEWDEFDLTDMDVFTRDSAYRAKANKWISDNPYKWIALAPKKIRRQLAVEHALNLRRVGDIVPRDSIPGKAAAATLPVYSRLYHVMLYLLAIIGIWIRRRHIWGIDGILMLPYLGAIVLAVLTVGGPRYQSPFSPVLAYFAAFAICGITTAIGRKRHPD